MPPKAGPSRGVKKKRISRKNAKTIRKPGKSSNLNPSLLPDQTQLGLNVEQTQPPISYDNLLSLMGEDHDISPDPSSDDEMEYEDHERPLTSSQPYSMQHEVHDLQTQNDCPEFGRPAFQERYQEFEQLTSSHEYQAFAQPISSSRHGYHEFTPPYDHQEFERLISLDHYPGQQATENDCPESGRPTFQERYREFDQPTTTSREYQAFAQPASSSQHGYHEFTPQHDHQGSERPISLGHYLGQQATEQFEPPKRSTFRDLRRLGPPGVREDEHARYSNWVSPIDFPGIRKVFVYDPYRPLEVRRGQLIHTGVIRATEETMVSAPVPSSRHLPSPTPDRASPHHAHQPYARRSLANETLKELMKEAVSIMRQKVLLENAMPMSAENSKMAETALSKALDRVVPGMPASQIPTYPACHKTLCSIATTVRGKFKEKARHEVPHHYNLTLPTSDVAAEVEHKRNTVPMLIKDRAYLFKDPVSQGLHSPVNHPAILEIIVATVFGSKLHTAIDLDDLDSLDNLFSVGGAAVHSSLMEYYEGAYRKVDFSASSASAGEYRAIQQHNLAINKNVALYNYFTTIKHDMVKRGQSMYSGTS